MAPFLTLFILRVALRSLIRTELLRLGRGEPLLHLLGGSLPFALALLITVDIGVLCVQGLRLRRPARFRKKDVSRSLWLWLLALAALAFLFLVHRDATSEGYNDAINAQHGRIIQSPLLGIAARPVRIQWADPVLSQEYGRDVFIYLGTGRFLVFYDRSRHLSIRVLPEKVTTIASLPI